MNPMLDASLRRNWKTLCAIAALLLLVALHVFWFLPTASRYVKVSKLLGADAGRDAATAAPLMPPRVFSFVTGNTLPPNSVEHGTSDQISVSLIEELSALASQNGLTITLSEPGPVTPTMTMVDARVHLRVRGGFRQMVAFLDAVQTQGHVYGVERYLIEGGDGDPLQLELWLSRLFLKPPGSKS